MPSDKEIKATKEGQDVERLIEIKEAISGLYPFAVDYMGDNMNGRGRQFKIEECAKVVHAAQEVIEWLEKEIKRKKEQEEAFNEFCSRGLY